MPFVLSGITNRACAVFFLLLVTDASTQTKLSASRFLRVRKLALHVSCYFLFLPLSFIAYWSDFHLTYLPGYVLGPGENREYGIRHPRPSHASHISPPFLGPSQPVVVVAPDKPPGFPCNNTRGARTRTKSQQASPPPKAGRSVGDLVQRYGPAAQHDARGRAAVRLAAVWRGRAVLPT